MPQVIGGRTLLSTSEARQQSGLSQRHLESLLRQSRLEGFRIGRFWVIYADSLKQYLQLPRKPGPKGPRRLYSEERT
jgi:hypothetical protein